MRKLLISALALLCLAALGPTPALAAKAAAPSHDLELILAGFLREPGHIPIPPPEGEFEDACGVAVDEFGDLYVSDYYHRTIDVYDPQQTYLTQIADPDPDGPCNLVVDSAGRLYVNHWRRDVVRYTPSSYPPSASTTYGTATLIDDGHGPDGNGERATGIALDPVSGDLYVDDRSYVAVYDPSGQPLLAGGEPLLIGHGSLQAGYGVAVSAFAATEGNVYVPDAAAGLVRVFAPSGEELAPVLGAGTPQRRFVSLYDSNVLVTPSNGHLYVADDTEPGFEHPAAVVDEFNPAGEYRGQLPQRLIDAEPSALAISAAGEIYASSGNDEGAILYGFGPTFPAHRLLVSLAGEGAGYVTSEPAGINCGPACAAEYNLGEEVILTAVPEPGSAFGGWSGGCAGTAPCHLEMNADLSVSASFSPAPPTALAQPALQSSLAPASLAAPPASSPAAKPARRAGGRHHRHRRRRHRHAQRRGGRGRG